MGAEVNESVIQTLDAVIEDMEEAIEKLTADKADEEQLDRLDRARKRVTFLKEQLSRY